MRYEETDVVQAATACLVRAFRGESVPEYLVQAAVAIIRGVSA